MQVAADRTDASTAIQTDLPAIFASLELSRSTWLITSLSPGAGEKMSKHSIRAGDVAGLLVRLAQLKEKPRGRTARDFPIIAIQEAGLDGFWVHRVLQSEGILFCGLGNYVDLRGLLGGAEGIRTSDLRPPTCAGAGTRAIDRARFG
jgi:hypothetical protein